MRHLLLFLCCGLKNMLLEFSFEIALAPVRANSNSGPGSQVDPELGPHRTMKKRREMSLGGAL